METSNKLCSKK